MRNLKLFFENLPSKASSLEINLWPCEQFSLEPASRIVPNLNRRLKITWNLIQSKNLVFEGQNGQKRPNQLYFSHICPYQTTAKLCLLWLSIIIRFQILSGRACKRGCFTVAWPSWPLKAKIFSPNNFPHYPWVMAEMGKNLDSWILILILEIVLDFDFENKSKLLLILILNLKRDHDNSWYWFWF